MHLLYLLLSLLVSIHICTAPSDSQANSSTFNFTAHSKDSLATHRSDNNAPKNENSGSIECKNCVDSVQEGDFVVSSGSGSIQPYVCEGCLGSGSGTVNVQDEGFGSLQSEECNGGDCNSGFGNNAESEVSSYSGSVFTPVDCYGKECDSGSGSGSGGCGEGDCGLPGNSEDEMTDASVYEKNGCEHSGGLLQWQCEYRYPEYCYNMSRCDTTALPGHQVCDRDGEDCVYVDRTDFTALYYRCVYDRMFKYGDQCYLVTALQQGDRYRLCEQSVGINTEPWCSDYPASVYCRYTQPSTNRLGEGCIYSDECEEVDCVEDEVTEASVYEKNGCEHSGGLVQWSCNCMVNGGVWFCYNMSRCDTAALPGRQVCDVWGEHCVYVYRTLFTALYYRCVYKERYDVCFLMTALQQGDRYTLCEYNDAINKEPHCSDYPASGYCTYTQPSTKRLGEGCIFADECGDVDCGKYEVTDATVYEKNDCRHSGGLVQWWCVYHKNVKHTRHRMRDCYNISRCDTAALPGRQVCYDSGKYCVYVDRTDFTALYYRCQYEGVLKDVCFLITTLQQGDRYTLCDYNWGINTHPTCRNPSASEYCANTQPSTNRLTHTTVPPTVYITGLLLNHLILLVLAWKAEATVTNCLLKLLAVWDSLYLVCQLAEWAVWMQTVEVPSVIKDVGYAWVETGCYLDRNSFIQSHEFCHMMIRWRGADYNVALRDRIKNLDHNHLLRLQNMYYVAMYFLHTAARLFQLMSVYQTVIIACFRYIAIQFPFQADRYLTYTTAWLATLGCLVVAGLLHVPSIIAGIALQTATECNTYKRNNEYTYKEFKQCLSDIAINNPFYATSYTSFMTFFHIYYVICYHIVMFFSLPFVILLVLNILMLRELWRGSQTQENIAVTRVVVAIVSVFLISYIIKPFYIIDIFYFDGSLMNSIAHSSCGSYFTMSVLIIVFPCLNSSVNFLIYIGFRESFRRQFVSMFDWCRMRCPCHCNQRAAVEEIELQGRT